MDGKSSKAVSFQRFASLCEKLENVSSTTRVRDELADFFEGLPPKSVRCASYFLLGKIGPKYGDISLGISDKTGTAIIAMAFEVDKDDVQKSFSKQGDLGDVVKSLSDQKKSSLTLEDVYKSLWSVKRTSGEGSQTKRHEKVAELLRQASGLEAKYIMRICLDAMRLGIGEISIIGAFSVAFAGGTEDKEEIENAYNVCTDIGQLGESLSKHGLRGAKRFRISLGRPVLVMLAQRVNKVSDILKKVKGEELAAEEKYDGERVEIHKDGRRVQLFSRRLEDITAQYPEIAEIVAKQVNPKKTVLDGEIVAFKNGKILPFQRLMERRRKYDVEEYRKKTPVVVFLFDILYLNGKSLLNTPYPERRERLEVSVETSKKIKLAVREVSSDFDDIKEFFEKSVKKGLEGIIVKSTSKDSVYQPGKRGWLWIKWKKEYAEGMQETFDVVVVGSYHGKGRRKGTFGALLCAVYNKDDDEFETFTKVGTGFTDEKYEEIEKALDEYKAEEKPTNVKIKKEMEPDEYYTPALVIEIMGAEITRSPKHTAGEQKGKGYALRFPRFLHIRPDKSADEATTTKEIRKLST
jgi:DNA ligase-1